MAYDFKNAVNPLDIHNALLQHFGAELTDEQKRDLRDIQRKWNFYEGFHWEEVPDTGKPQVTENYCRAFVNKFVAFEFGKGFKIKMLPEIEQIDGDNDPLDFLNKVWGYNNREQIGIELGQSKSVTGDAWVQIGYEAKTLANGQANPNFDDPFNEYPKGKIRIIVVPTSVCFPEYAESFDKDRLVKLTILYPSMREKKSLFGRSEWQKTVFKQVWTDKSVEMWEGKDKVNTLPNKYGVIPFKQIKNMPLQGKTRGISDLEDIMPLNMELNLKRSDVSEIIDYHSAPITVVFGARVGNLERGANKVWGGLPKDAKVENLKLDGDLAAANTHIQDIKQAIHEIGQVPKGAMGGDLAISNTSGIALQIALMPLLERIDMKLPTTKEGLAWINKMILHIALIEEMITLPANTPRDKFLHNEVLFESILPKDEVLELQNIEVEMKLGLENREGALERLGRPNIQEKIAQVDKDRKENAVLYGLDPKTGLPIDTAMKQVGNNADGQTKKPNAGYTNGPEPKK